MDILDKAERIDSYRSECSASFLNNEARKGQSYELSKISADAAKSLRNAIDVIPLYDSCEIAIINSDADNGFPHTRPNNIVCIPESLCSTTPATPKFMETLIHEGIHVHQRLNEDLWLDGLKRVNWTPVSSDVIPDEFKERLRLNPDTIMKPFWAWSKYHVPLCMFKDRKNPKLTSTVVEWFDIRTGSLFHDPPNGFKKIYTQHIHQMEHPYEIYAEILAAKDIKTPNGVREALVNLNYTY